MPELPEVETNVRALRPHLIDREIINTSVFTTKLRHHIAKENFFVLNGQRIKTVRRRAKYIIVDMTGSHSLLIHLGMTGAFRVCPMETERKKHEHVIFNLDNGQSWRYEDQRKFGTIEVWNNSQGEWPERLLKLGPEPLENDFSGEYLRQVSKNRMMPVKKLIMDQQFVVGVGNIYASEALFRSRINPKRKAGAISGTRYARLANEIKFVLNKAIAKGGTTIADFKSVDGSEGRFAIDLKVYGREGKMCPACKSSKIKRSVIGGRSTYYCSKCQN